ncbi:MAG: type IV pilus modification protein PilV [Gammaproteobacteria bacterium]|nr:type IV pilus modification protein PilV [Gammaproteobacteria bacterium]
MKNNRYQNYAKKSVQGFTLLEVLITVVILAIGLLGLAGLQAASLQNNNDAATRSQAAVLAYDIADRVRANPLGATAGNYNLPNATPVTACTVAPGCTPAQLAQNDAFEWNTSIAQALPAGQGVICIDSSTTGNSINDGTSAADHGCDGNGNTFAVKLWWDSDRNALTPNQLFATSFQP